MLALRLRDQTICSSVIKGMVHSLCIYSQDGMEVGD